MRRKPRASWLPRYQLTLVTTEQGQGSNIPDDCCTADLLRCSHRLDHYSGSKATEHDGRCSEVVWEYFAKVQEVSSSAGFELTFLDDSWLVAAVAVLRLSSL